MAVETTLSRVAGALLVVGFEGVELTKSLATAMREGRRAGAILFRRNLPDVATMRALTRELHEACVDEEPPIVAIDEEGGRVTRVPAPSRKLPAMRELGSTGDVALAERAARVVALDLRRSGVNLDFAPVLDVDSNPENPVIGDRSFSRDPAVVAAFGIAFSRGLNDGGVLACGKHFPGHGDTDTDSHFALPTIRLDRPRLDAIELRPFEALARAGIDSLMSAHLVATALDPNLPATLSSATCTDLLRETLGFKGVLFSDDLEMKAVSAAREVEANAVMAIAAGCDALLVCKSEELAERAHAALVGEMEKSPTFRARCAEARERMTRLRRKAADLGRLSMPDDTEALWSEVLRAIDEAKRAGDQP